ncbi:chromate transporter [bacterium]|nr:chromate transporter [bacterium]
MILFILFVTFLKISLCAIGGAYSFLPLMERELVDKYGWLTKQEFLDIIGITRMFPGAISIKFASYAGYKIAGIPGLIAANFGNLLATVTLVVFASAVYLKLKDAPYVQEAFSMVKLAVCAMLLAMIIELLKTNQLTELTYLVRFRSLLVFSGAFVLFVFTKIDPALIIMGAGLFGAAAFFLSK